MTPDDALVAEIETLLRQVAVILRKRGREILSGFEITPPQFDALLVLTECGAVTMGELCEKMYLACSTATDLIDRMERNGLIARERDPNDRRIVRLHVLERGRGVIDAVMAARKRYLSQILEQVPAGERRRLARALERIHILMTQEVAAVR